MEDFRGSSSPLDDEDEIKESIGSGEGLNEESKDGVALEVGNNGDNNDQASDNGNTYSFLLP